MMKKLHDTNRGMKKSRTLFLMVLSGFVGTFASTNTPEPAKIAEYLPPPDSIEAVDQRVPADSLPTEMSGVNEPVTEGYTKFGTYPFLRTSQNFIEWKDEEAAKTFFTKLTAAGKRKFRVLHVGDSHLQADIYTGYIREELQKLYGTGGRGLVFPYSAAKTHSAYDYFTYSKGNWTFTKNTEGNPAFDIGLTGYSIKTTDPNANFKLVFSKTIKKHNRNKIRIFTSNTPETFDIVLKVKGVEQPVELSPSTSPVSWVETIVDSDCESIELFLKKSTPAQNSIEFYGMIVESDTENGVLYASTGVNGAVVSSIMRQKRFAEELKAFNPDLFILDLGINDFFGGGYNAAALRESITSVIRKVKETTPEAVVMLLNVQDAFNKRTNVQACKDFAILVQEIAFENGCLFYDIYNVSGGRNSMLNWRSNFLANVDQIHLTSKGYNLKGELFLTAVKNSFEKFASGGDQLVINNKNLESTVPENLAIYVDNNEAQSVSTANTTVITGGTNTSTLKDDSGNYKLHKVLGGESLRSIAKLYNVEIGDIRNWNNFYGALAVNQELKIYVKKEKSKPVATAPRAANYNYKPNTTATSYSRRNAYYGRNYANNYRATTRNTTPKVTNYSVRSGDTWYAISKRTGIPVNQLKAANGAKGDNIRPGQKIKVPAKNQGYTAATTKTKNKYGTKYNTNKAKTKTTVKAKTGYTKKSTVKSGTGSKNQKSTVKPKTGNNQKKTTTKQNTKPVKKQNTKKPVKKN
ncbi:MAG: hypothetical protein HBSAPP04_21440 [Ignavibacteriaceae bacterium]|nr:MAG: hypothetical protein HBSAPP04_21440 [Ignavibacteriaceae bacterium]